MLYSSTSLLESRWLACAIVALGENDGKEGRGGLDGVWGFGERWRRECDGAEELKDIGLEEGEILFLWRCQGMGSWLLVYQCKWDINE